MTPAAAPRRPAPRPPPGAGQATHSHTRYPRFHPKRASTETLVRSVFYPQCPNLIFGVSSFDFWPEQNKVLQFDCIAEGVFMKEHLQKGALLVALGIVVIVGGFIFTAAVLGLWLNSIGNLAP